MKSLSKSQYTRGMNCAKSLWLYRNKRELQGAVTPAQQATFDSGKEFGILAQKRFPGGTLIEADYTEPEKALQETKEAIEGGWNVIYEAALLYDEVLVRVDVLIRNPAGWHMYEVKSSTEVKPEHLHDVAIQRYVVNGAGFPLSSAHVVIVDNGYVRQGELNISRLFKIVDVTDESQQQLDMVPMMLTGMKQMEAEVSPPDAAIGGRCYKPYDCDFQGVCWEKVPDYSVFDLAGALWTKKEKLWHGGVKTIDEIPLDEKISAFQQTQRMVARNGKTFIDVAPIREHLAQLVYPLFNLDFETVAPAIPPYDGLRPYQAIPFQASIHVQKERGAPVEHFEFLADGTKDPRNGVIDFLWNTIGGVGSVIAYSKGFEGGVIEKLKDRDVIKAVELGSMVNRLWDVAEPFKKGWYAHPEFRGSWSIKKVLPVCVPGMSYEWMGIADGTAAMRAYERLLRTDLTPEERAKIMADLRAYCGQDTLGMVKLLEFLYVVAGL